MTNINQVIEYMKANANENLKVENIARRFGYSKFHFSREFKKETGISPSEFLSSLKIDKGIKYVLKGKKVIDSQLEAGFSSAGSFTNTFSKNTGLTPKEYYNNAESLYQITKEHELLHYDDDSLFYRNPNFPIIESPYKLTVQIDVPLDFDGLVFCGLFLKPNPNHHPIMGRCRSHSYRYEFYNLPKCRYYPLACGIKKSLNPFHYFQLEKSMRACEGDYIDFPLQKDKMIHIKLRPTRENDPPILINLPNILATAIKQQMKRNRQNFKKSAK